MNTPDQGIPQDLLESAKCIAIIPGEVKVAFIFGGSYGRGLATCRTEHGWSAPMFVAIDSGSVGYQIRGSSTDLVMLFMNDHALQSLMSDKFKLGADASVAAGPVGRNAAGTDLKLNAEILSYSRSKGILAGVNLDGAVMQADKSGDKAMYGDDVNRHVRPCWLESVGGHYIDGRQITPEHFIDKMKLFDLILEATGIASLEFDLIDALAVNGVYVVTDMTYHRAIGR